jgi:hypothetical protein
LTTETKGDIVQRKKYPVEDSAYVAMMRRMIRAMGKRASEGDLELLAEMKALKADIDERMAAAVAKQREQGVSWAQIGDALGMSRQAAQQKWGQP